MQTSDTDSISSTEEHGVPCLPLPMGDPVPILSIETDKHFHLQTTVPRMLAILPCLREMRENPPALILYATKTLSTGMRAGESTEELHKNTNPMQSIQLILGDTPCGESLLL